MITTTIVFITFLLLSSDYVFQVEDFQLPIDHKVTIHRMFQLFVTVYRQHPYPDVNLQLSTITYIDQAKNDNDYDYLLPLAAAFKRHIQDLGNQIVRVRAKQVRKLRFYVVFAFITTFTYI